MPTIRKWKSKYPTILPSFFNDKNHVNGYVFIDKLCESLSEKVSVVTGMGQDVVSFQQIFRVKQGQKAFVNKNFGQMGWCLPAAIGMSVANNKGQVVLITGDGSIQFNLHELQTISYYNLPITIFIFNNGGYKSIRDMQNTLFDHRLIGADTTSGVSHPDFKKLAGAFNIPYYYFKDNAALRSLKRIISNKGPKICELNINKDQERIPRPGTFVNDHQELESLPLYDMLPRLPQIEIEEIIHAFD
jgi:acetolactate synthase I/II/III large subunit